MNEFSHLLEAVIYYMKKYNLDFAKYFVEGNADIELKKNKVLEFLEFIIYFSNNILNLNLKLHDILIIFMLREISHIRYFPEDRDVALKNFFIWLLMYLKYISPEDYKNEKYNYYYDYKVENWDIEDLEQLLAED